jgi:hypothetical protein
MANSPRHRAFDSRSELRNVLFVLPAIALLLLKGQYSGPFQELIHSYAGNVTVSFALYFVVLRLCMSSPQFGRVIAVAVVLVCVESFELFDGFRIMSNTYDAFDLLANVIGVGLALSLDAILCRKRQKDLETNVEG